MEKKRDASQVGGLCERIKKNYPGADIGSHSFDKGFWSKDNFEILQKAAIEQMVLPKKGRHSKEDKERESETAYKKLRNAHSAIESNINMLEPAYRSGRHHGLNRCVDKGLHGWGKSRRRKEEKTKAENSSLEVKKRVISRYNMDAYAE